MMGFHKGNRSLGPTPGRLCGGTLLFRVFGAHPRLQAVEVVGGALRVAGGGEDEALVPFQDGQ